MKKILSTLLVFILFHTTFVWADNTTMTTDHIAQLCEYDIYTATTLCRSYLAKLAHEKNIEQLRLKVKKITEEYTTQQAQADLLLLEAFANNDMEYIKKQMNQLGWSIDDIVSKLFEYASAYDTMSAPELYRRYHLLALFLKAEFCFFSTMGIGLILWRILGS